MNYTNYITIKRARFQGMTGEVNIPYGTEVYHIEGFLVTENTILCKDNSQNAHDYFARNDDGHGLERGKLTQTIQKRLGQRNGRDDEIYQSRWDKVWEDEVCQKYKRAEYDDYWLWNHDFYNAPIEDLRYIAELLGAK